MERISELNLETEKADNTVTGRSETENLANKGVEWGVEGFADC